MSCFFKKVCGNTDFEEGQNTWMDDGYGDLEWFRVRADQSTNGPQLDHTLNSPLGYYMSVGSSGGSGWSVAVLELFREIKPCPSECEIEFYYHMRGDDDELMVYLEETDSNNVWDIYTRLWTVSGDQGKCFI